MPRCSVHFLFVLSLLLAGTGYAQSPPLQTEAILGMEVQIVESSIEISVSSSRLSFGEVPQGAGTIQINPASGERDGEAWGAHTTGELVITGPPGARFLIQATPPAQFHAGSGERHGLEYSLLWAYTPLCEGVGYTTLHDVWEGDGVIGSSGCTRFQFGGTIHVPDIPPGLYRANMTVHILQQ